MCLAGDEVSVFWSKIKKEYGAETTEELFGFDAPSEHQCDHINKIIKKCNKIYDYSRYTAMDDEGSMRDKLDDINYDANGFDDEIEELRTAIESVRAWGNEWKNLCKKLMIEEKDNINLEKYI